MPLPRPGAIKQHKPFVFRHADCPEPPWYGTTKHAGRTGHLTAIYIAAVLTTAPATAAPTDHATAR